MGEIIGNFAKDEAIAFLRGFAEGMSDDDRVMVAADGCEDSGKVL